MKYLLALVIFLFSFNAIAEETIWDRVERKTNCIANTMSEAEREFYVRFINSPDEQEEMSKALISLLQRMNITCDEELFNTVNVIVDMARAGDIQAQFFMNQYVNVYSITLQNALSDMGYVFQEQSSFLLGPEQEA